MASSQQKVSRAVYGLGMLLIGGGGLHWWLGARAFAQMREGACTVLSRKIDLHFLVASGRRDRPTRVTGHREEAHLVLAHVVGERQYTFPEDFVHDWSDYAHLRFEEGKAYPCRYDPEDPAEGTVRNEFDARTSNNFMALGAVVLLIGVAVPGLFKLAAENAKERRRLRSTRIFER